RIRDALIHHRVAVRAVRTADLPAHAGEWARIAGAGVDARVFLRDRWRKDLALDGASGARGEREDRGEERGKRSHLRPHPMRIPEADSTVAFSPSAGLQAERAVSRRRTKLGARTPDRTSKCCGGQDVREQPCSERSPEYCRRWMALLLTKEQMQACDRQ